MANPIAEPQYDENGNPAVEVLPDDAAVVREKLTGSSDTDFMRMMGLKKAGEQAQEEDEEVEEAAEKAEEELEEKPESREARAHKAAAAKRGIKEAPKEEEEAEQPEAEAEEEPEANAEEAPEAEAGEQPKLLTQFVLKQGNEEVDIPRDVTFDFKANGKEYKDLSLDKVVLMAQMGFYNEARENEVQHAKRYVAEVGQRALAAEQGIAAIRKEVEDLLRDEQYYEVAKSEFLRRNTPEERTRRAQEELRQERASAAANQQKLEAQAYIQQNILPAVEGLLQTFPGVSEDEVMGRFNRIITPYLVNGVVPPQHLPTVKSIVDTDMKAWAQALSVERETTRKKQEEKTEARVKTEKTKTTLAKRELARAVKPHGTAVNVKEAKKPKQYKSADDWANTAIDDILKDAIGRQ